MVWCGRNGKEGLDVLGRDGKRWDGFGWTWTLLLFLFKENSFLLLWEWRGDSWIICLNTVPLLEQRTLYRQGNKCNVSVEHHKPSIRSLITQF